jgi:hypothetical protein
VTGRFPAGSRVRLTQDVDRYPHFVARAGSTGTVVDLGDPQIVLAVRLDEPLAGAEEWHNEVHWLAGDAELNDLSVDAYLALYVELVDDGGAAYVRHDALRAASDAELRGVIADGGPTALIDAARDELAGRVALHETRTRLSRSSSAGYERASADVVLPLTRAQAEQLVESCGRTGRPELAAYIEGYLADPVEVVVRALDRVPAGSWLLEPQARSLVLVEAADRALATLPGYDGSVPEGRRFVADVLADTPHPDRHALAAWLVDELTAE